MRILFLTLLVLNLGFLGYHLAIGQEETGPRPIQLSGSNVEALEPLSTPETQAEEGVPGPSGSGSKTGKGADTEPSADEAVGGGPEEAEKEAATASAAGDPGIVEPPADQAATGDGPGDNADAGPACYALGPLTSGLQKQVESRVDGSNLTIVHRWEGARQEARFWVYLPPAADMGRAGAQQKALESAGYRDILLVRNGELAGSISLGVFADRDNAREHQENLRGDGFDARIRERTRRTSAPFIGLRVPDTAGPQLAEFRRLLRDSEASLRERPCDQIQEE